MGAESDIDPLAGAPQAPPGTPEAAIQAQLRQKLDEISKSAITGSFRWPYYGAAIIAILALPFSLLTGRRIGQFFEVQEHAGGPEDAERFGRAMGAIGEAAAPPGGPEAGALSHRDV